MREDILKILKEMNAEGDFENSADFVEDGLLDSFEVVNLVSELEEAFSVEISGKDIIPENFINLDTIEVLINRYTGGE